MKSFLKTIPVPVFFLVVCQAAPAVTTTATYSEIAEAQLEMPSVTILDSRTGTDDAQPETIELKARDVNPDHPGTYSATVRVTTSNTGPNAQSIAVLGTMRTAGGSEGYYRADADGFADIYYHTNLLNKGLTIDRYLWMPVEVKAKGEAAALQINLGEAGSTAGIQIVRISDTGHESVLLDQWANAYALPTDGCKYRLSDCSKSKMTQKLDIEATFAVLLEPGKPVPTLQVNVVANTRVKSGTAFSLTSAYPPAYEFWGGEAVTYAWMDPVINIDPTWEYAEWFDLEFSPGVVQAVVPIPATVWLFGSGLLGLIGVSRRKKSN